MKCLYHTPTDGADATATHSISNMNGIIEHSSASINTQPMQYTQNTSKDISSTAKKQRM